MTYATEEERTARRRERQRKNARRYRERWVNASAALALEEGEMITIPGWVRRAQERRIQFMIQAMELRRVTANQFILGEPFKSQGVIASLSAIQYKAILS